LRVFVRRFSPASPLRSNMLAMNLRRISIRDHGPPCGAGRGRSAKIAVAVVLFNVDDVVINSLPSSAARFLNALRNDHRPPADRCGPDKPPTTIGRATRVLPSPSAPACARLWVAALGGSRKIGFIRAGRIDELCSRSVGVMSVGRCATALSNAACATANDLHVRRGPNGLGIR
jgi:hypothetical protein